MTKKNGKDGKVGISVQPDYSVEFPKFYSNFVSVSHTPNDLCLDFCLVAPPHNVQLDDKVLYTPMVSRVIITPDIATGLITALQEQLKKQKRSVDEGMIIQSKKKGEKNDTSKQ